MEVSEGKRQCPKVSPISRLQLGSSGMRDIQTNGLLYGERGHIQDIVRRQLFLGERGKI